MFKWLNTRTASDLGNQLADGVVAESSRRSSRKADGAERGQRLLQEFLRRVDHDAVPQRFNVLQRAKLANTFKWRLIEKGIETPIADELTRALVVRLSERQAGPQAPAPRSARPQPSKPAQQQALLDKGATFFAQGAYGEAVSCFRELLASAPEHAVAHNSLGAALYKQGLYGEAEREFSRAITLKPGYADALSNLGTVLRGRGLIGESEAPLRQALKLKPAQSDFQLNLAMTLLLLGRLAEAKALLEKVLRVGPRNVDALLVMGDVAANEGRMTEAESLYKRALEIAPNAAGAWAGLARVRKMTAADSGWLEGAERALGAGLTPVDEATVRYAIGKYYDDTGEYKRAFRSYDQANELQRRTAEPYNREARARFVDDLIRLYSREALAQPRSIVSDSQRPVFVVGMMRSGTSLVEQIIASHRAAAGAGELPYWLDAMRKHDNEVRHELLGDARREELATGYLRTLERNAPKAERVVDKLPVNSDYLGVIHCVFPNARFIYVQRDPIDTCLSCYFQQLSSGHSYALDLSDLAHYYREHHRLIAHWRGVLPPGKLLDVPYDALVAEQEDWTRRIVAFLGLDWDEHCLDFYQTARPVLTASVWQVRQKIYRTSVDRWRNYEKYIGPLRGLRSLA